MTALLSVFRPVPPLVRKKATSLLETIRAAVKESLSPKLGSNEGGKLKISEEKPSMPGMDVDVPSAGSRPLGNKEEASASILWTSRKPGK